jgi:hypothetical protein
MATEKEEMLDIGRKVALVARRDKELYEKVKRVAKQRGKTLQDVLSEAFELWYLYETLEQIDPKTLAIAIQLIRHLMEWSIDTMVKMGAVFTSEFIRSNIAVATDLARTLTPPSQSAQSAQSQIQQIQSPQQLVQYMYSQLVAPLLTTVMSLMMQMISRIPGAQLSAQVPQFSTPVAQSMQQIRVEE